MEAKGIQNSNFSSGTVSHHSMQHSGGQNCSLPASSVPAAASPPCLPPPVLPRTSPAVPVLCFSNSLTAPKAAVGHRPGQRGQRTRPSPLGRAGSGELQGIRSSRYFPSRFVMLTRESRFRCYW